MCKIASVDYIDDSSFNPKKLVNNNQLHLNEKESYKLNSVFLHYIITLFKRYEYESPVDMDSLYGSV